MFFGDPEKPQPFVFTPHRLDFKSIANYQNMNTTANAIMRVTSHVK